MVTHTHRFICSNCDPQNLHNSIGQHSLAANPLLAELSLAVDCPLPQSQTFLITLVAAVQICKEENNL